jgi:hypothetical protein
MRGSGLGAVGIVLAACHEQEFDIVEHEDTSPEVDTNVYLPPEADAGPDQAVWPLNTVALDGSASIDPQGLPLEYRWTLAVRPAGSQARLENPTAVNPTFFADLAGEYLIDLAVENSAGERDESPDRVLVHAEPGDRFYVQLSWDSEADLDLHLSRNGAGLYAGNNDISWCHDAASWGAPGGDDDPSLDADTINGFGPETITIPAPADETFHVRVHYYGERGYNGCDFICPTTVATVRVFVDGVEREVYTQTFAGVRQVWDVATVDWSADTITPVGTLTSTNLSGCD